MIHRLVSENSPNGGPGVMAALLEGTPEDFVFTLKGYGYFSGPVETVEVPDPNPKVASRPGFRLVRWGHLPSLRRVFNAMKQEGPLVPPPKPPPADAEQAPVSEPVPEAPAPQGPPAPAPAPPEETPGVNPGAVPGTAEGGPSGDTGTENEP